MHGPANDGHCFLIEGHCLDVDIWTWNEALIRCGFTYIVVPVVDLRIQRPANKRRKGKKTGPRFRLRAKAQPTKPKKNNVPPPKTVYRKWPVFTPKRLLQALDKANALHLLKLAECLSQHVLTYPEISIQTNMFPEMWFNCRFLQLYIIFVPCLESKDWQRRLVELLGILQDRAVGNASWFNKSPYDSC